MSAEDEALDAGEVGEEADTGETVLAGNVGDALPLIMPDLEGDAAAWEEVSGGFL